MRVYLAALLIACAPLAACGGSGAGSSPGSTATPTPTPLPSPTPTPTSSPPAFSIVPASRADDPRIATVTSEGAQFVVSGKKNAAGIPTLVNQIQAHDPKMGSAGFTFDQQHRITGVQYDDGSFFDISYNADTTNISAGAPNAAPIQISLANSQIKTQSASSASARSLTAFAAAPTGLDRVDVSVNDCGRSKATVYVDIRSRASGVVLRSILAEPLGNGTYEAYIPSDDDSLDVDFHAKDTAQSLADALNDICKSKLYNSEIIQNACDQFSRLPIPNKAVSTFFKICNFTSEFLKAYCFGLDGTPELDSIINSIPEILKIYKPDLYVQARYVAAPQSILSGVADLKGGVNYNFSISVPSPCPKITFFNLPEPNIPFFSNVYYYVDNDLVAIVPKSEDGIPVDLRYYGSGNHSISLLVVNDQPNNVALTKFATANGADLVNCPASSNNTYLNFNVTYGSIINLPCTLRLN